jgi:Spy/CpxP family protein refolding chaperone
MKRATIFLLVAGSWLGHALFAQVVTSVRPGVPYQPGYTELKTALDLTDEQVNQLKRLQQERITASQAVYTQISQKQKQLTDLLTAGSSDAATIGNLNIEIQRLRTQVNTQPPASIKDQALAVLTPDQKTKLEKLQEALNLRAAADQAAGMNLIEYPKTATPVLPMGIVAK